MAVCAQAARRVAAEKAATLEQEQVAAERAEAEAEVSSDQHVHARI
jgi:hypothetical protein